MEDKDTIETSVLDHYDIHHDATNASQAFARTFFYYAELPVTFFREGFIQPLKDKLRGEKPVYYHRQYKRVPTVDECYQDDLACVFEADVQFRRDRLVDQEILKLLGMRMRNCMFYNQHEGRVKCREIVKDCDLAHTNFFIKYGEISQYECAAKQGYYKQKHRFMFLRRHPDSNLMPKITDPDTPPEWAFKAPFDKRPTIFWKNIWKSNIW